MAAAGGPAAERRTCRHCGLPRGGLGYSPDGHDWYCCYGCYLASRIVGAPEGGGAPAWVLARLGVGAFLAMNVMMVSLLLYSGEIQDLGPHTTPVLRWLLLGLSTPAFLILGLPFLAGMGREVRHARPSLDTLVAIGAASAFGVSAAHVILGEGRIYFDTATMLLMLVTVGKLLEAHTKTRTAALVKGLLAARPATARVLRDGVPVDVPAEAVRPGEVVRVGPGERVPVDGRILSGSTSVQESAFTGEPLPRVCVPGDRVLGGSANCDGEVLVEAEGVGDASLLSRIARFVEEACAARAPVERLVERVSAVFVPVVALTAVGALAFWWLRGDPARGGMSALAVLVVACPCALGLATPLVTALAIGRAAREGVLVRSGAILERLPQVQRVFLDKTGTLTRGRMAVTGVVHQPVAGESLEEALAWVCSLERAVSHPIAEAVAAEGARRGLACGTTEGLRAVAGRGATGTVTLAGRRRQVYVGTAAFLEESGLAVPAGLRGPLAGQAVTYGGWPDADGAEDAGRACLAFALSDELRPEAAEAVGRLKEHGLVPAVISGDHEDTTRQVAAQAGITEVHAPCLPDEKLRALQAAQAAGQVVAMVGDGANDAPALAVADVGIAVGTTDLAHEASDVTLVGDDLLRVPWVLGLSRRAYATIARNLTWAFGYNAVALVAAFLGYLHPLVAVVAMLGSSAFILTSSLRLVRYPGPAPAPQPGAGSIRPTAVSP